MLCSLSKYIHPWARKWTKLYDPSKNSEWNSVLLQEVPTGHKEGTTHTHLRIGFACVLHSFIQISRLQLWVSKDPEVTKVILILTVQHQDLQSSIWVLETNKSKNSKCFNKSFSLFPTSQHWNLRETFIYSNGNLRLRSQSRKGKKNEGISGFGSQKRPGMSLTTLMTLSRNKGITSPGFSFHWLENCPW